MQVIKRNVSFVILAILLSGLAAVPGPAAAGESGMSPHAGMLRDPDVSSTHIVFRYADDLWLVPREGGTALPAASPPGEEMFPRFSPDGSMLAFVAYYDGDPEIYTMPAGGGVPVRVTHQPGPQALCDWVGPDRLMYYTGHRNGLLARTEIFTVGAEGGMPSPVPVPYGADASLSEDGRYLAYVPVMRYWVAGWKRYIGGSASDIWIMDLEKKSWREATDWAGSDVMPMWHGGVLYYVSDAGPEHRRNIWSWDPESGDRRQLTRHEHFDVRTPAVGPGPSGEGEIVYTAGDEMHLLELQGGEDRIVEVRVPGARSALRPRSVDVSGSIGHFSLSPGGKRVAVEARGDIWTLPAENGSPRNLTRSSAAAERYPAWSPDGRWIACFSDRSGEYELHVLPSDGRGEGRRVTSGHETFFYPPVWSPDSRSLVFQEKSGEIWLCGFESGKMEKIGSDPWPSTTPGGRSPVSFSPDGRWIACSLSEPSNGSIRSIWLYDTEDSKLHRATGALADETLPVFGRDGDYLYFAARRAFDPVYSEIEFTWAYENTQVLYAMPLRDGVKSPFAPVSDEVSWDDGEEGGDADGGGSESGDGPEGEGPGRVEIDIAGIQERSYRLPAAPGTFSGLMVDDTGNLVYLRRSGEDGSLPSGGGSRC